MDVMYCDFLSLPPCVRIAKFARLLPSLNLVTVSQAPSPESKPNSPLPVIATVGQYPTVGS